MKIRTVLDGCLVFGEVDHTLYLEADRGDWIFITEKDGSFEVLVKADKQFDLGRRVPLVRVVNI